MCCAYFCFKAANNALNGNRRQSLSHKTYAGGGMRECKSGRRWW